MRNGWGFQMRRWFKPVALLRAIFAASPGLAAMGAVAMPAQTGSLAAGVAAIVNGVVVSEAQIDAAARLAGWRPDQHDALPLRQAIRQQLIVRELCRQAAQKAHYGAREEVLHAAPDARADVEIELYVRDRLHQPVVTDAQLRARYDELVALLGPLEYKARLIAVRDEATARQALAALHAGQPFDAVARQYSEAPSRAEGGELPWASFSLPLKEGRTQGYPLVLAQAITRLAVGALSAAPLKAGNSWLIVKLDAARPTRVPPFDDVRGLLLQQLRAEAQHRAALQLAEALYKDAVIEP